MVNIFNIISKKKNGVSALKSELESFINQYVSGSISDKEINRGKSQLKASLMMGRESAFRRCESSARQLLTHNKIIEPNEIIKKIDAVNLETVVAIATKVLSTPITIASIGPIKKLESRDKIIKRLNN